MFSWLFGTNEVLSEKDVIYTELKESLLFFLSAERNRTEGLMDRACDFAKSRLMDRIKRELFNNHENSQFKRLSNLPISRIENLIEITLKQLRKEYSPSLQKLERMNRITRK